MEKQMQKNEMNVKKKLRKSSLKKEFKSTCMDWIQDSPFNGLSNIFKTNHFTIKLLWIAFSLVMIVLCIKQIIEQIQEFNKREVVNRITIKSQAPAYFPTIFICNLNFLSTSYGADFAQMIIKNYTATASTNENAKNFLKNPNVQRGIVLANLNLLNDNEKRKMGVFGQNFVKSNISCIYDGDLCDFNDFDWFFDSFFGNCLRFNANHTKTLTQSGSKNGLSMEIYIGDGDENVEFTRTRGLHLFVTNSSTNTKDALSIDIPTGMSTNIALDYSLTYRMVKPYSTCNPSEGYSQSICKQYCYQQFVINKCSCYDSRALRSNEQIQLITNGCVHLNELVCLVNASIKFADSKEKKSCDTECPYQCNSIQFEYMLSMSDFPAESYANYLINSSLANSLFENKTMTYQTLKKSSAAFDLFYNELEYTEIYEEPKLSENDLKSNIGGAVGLYIGISIVSLCQFLEILIQLIIVYVKWKSNNDSSLQMENF